MPDKPRNHWNSSFALQIPTVDAQHKGLFDLAYELDCAIYEGKEQAVVDRVVERLKEYCQHHFVTEEQLMHEHAYPGLHAHMLQHDAFTSAVIEFDAQRESGATAVSQRIASFLEEWLADHIAVEDRKIALFILQQPAGQGPDTKGVPLLLEVEAAAKQPDTAVCARTAESLMAHGVLPVGLADSIGRARTILEEMRSHELTPAIFVVNTFGARDILGDLDPLMDELPVLYLRRALFAGRSGLMDQVNLVGPASPTATALPLAMKPRLTSMWFYGARNADRIARRAAEAVGAFLRTGDFRQIERTKTAN
ncbi:MAG: bacteriohemerythrin [Planctomycetota bacterium]|nr:bacteriohemerythrin [Planctomycetota bacterium]